MRHDTLPLVAAFLLVFVGIVIGAVAVDALDDAIVRGCIVRALQ